MLYEILYEVWSSMTSQISATRPQSSFCWSSKELWFPPGAQDRHSADAKQGVFWALSKTCDWKGAHLFEVSNFEHCLALDKSHLFWRWTKSQSLTYQPICCGSFFNGNFVHPWIHLWMPVDTIGYLALEKPPMNSNHQNAIGRWRNWICCT